jgi:hypothetical protein
MASGGLSLENLNSSLINNMVHQFDQVALKVRLRVLFGEGLNHMINELFQWLSADLFIFTALMEYLEEVLCILFTEGVSIRLIYKGKCLD